MMQKGNPMVGLAVETSGRIGCVAIGRGDAVLETRAFTAGRRHAVELLPTVAALCAAHGALPGDVEAIYVSGGPGSFTGLRVGVTFAKTLAMNGQIRVVRVSTLDVVAQNALRADSPPTDLAVVLDAKRGRVYAARYVLTTDDQPAYARVSAPAEVDPASFLAGMPPGGGVMGEGVPYHTDAVTASGLVVLPEALYAARAEVVYALGRRLAAAGECCEPDRLTPVYVRRPEAEEVFERRQATDRERHGGAS